MSENNSKIIVIYGKANTLSLPYALGEGKVRAVKYQKFVPGRNEILKPIWDAINAELGEDRMANYARVLKPLDVEVSEDGKINFDGIKSVGDMCDLIEETMTLDGLDEIEAYENARDKPRVTVIKAVEEQRSAIKSFNDKVEAGED